MHPPTLALIETSVSSVLGRAPLDSSLLRLAYAFSRYARVLVACWHQIQLDAGAARLRPPFLELEDGESRVWSPEVPTVVDALWHYPVAGGRIRARTTAELDAESRFTAMGIRCDGVPVNTSARVLSQLAHWGVVTNGSGTIGRLGRKDQLEYALRWYTRWTGRRMARPETHPCVGARLRSTLAAFAGRDCIVKPANSGGGRGIMIVPACTAGLPPIDPTAHFVVQELVRDPLVVGGAKMDLRCYLLVNGARRERSRRIGPIFARAAAAPYTPLVHAAEVTNTSLRKRLGLRPSIQPLEQALAHDATLCGLLRQQVEHFCELVIDLIFTWRDENHPSAPLPTQTMLWGLDLLPCGLASAPRLKLLEINIHPQLHRDDEPCNALVDEMMIRDYLPELIGRAPGVSETVGTGVA